MVTGNFALLAGVSPQELHEWYLIVYADAYEWVELPNTLGMSQFADGGLLASKPYAASGAYIDRMSDYCKGCAYDVKARTGAARLPLQRALLGFHEPPSRRACEQSAHRADLPRLRRLRGGREGRDLRARGAHPAKSRRPLASRAASGADAACLGAPAL